MRHFTIAGALDHVQMVIYTAEAHGGILLAEIRIFDGESIESAMRRFKRQVQQEGIIKEIKKHSYFLKPGEKKRLKSKLAQKLKRKKQRRLPGDTDSQGPRRQQS